MAGEQVTTIDIPGVGPVDFPSSMSEAEMTTAAKRLHDEHAYTPDPTMTGAATRAIARNAGGVGLGLPATTNERGEPLQRPNAIVQTAVTNPALQSLAHPTSVADMAALLVPNAMGAGETSVPSLVRGTLRTLKAGGQAAADGPLASSPIRFMRGALAELKRPLSVESFAPNTSGGSFVADAEKLNRWDTALDAAPKGIPQGVYAPLSDGSWGVRALPGHQLAEGQAVNVMSRSGVPKVITVGKVGPDGVAALGGGSLPSEPISIGGLNVTDPRMLEVIRQRLGAQ